MPKTPIKFGVKVWVNAEANTGYILNFQVYPGAVDEPSSKGHPHRVVIDLMQEFQGRGREIFFRQLLHECTSVERVVRKWHLGLWYYTPE